MGETYGLPEEEPLGPTVVEQAQQVAEQVIAGQGLIRTVSLYAVTGLLLISPVPQLALVPLILLLASDGRLT